MCCRLLSASELGFYPRPFYVGVTDEVCLYLPCVPYLPVHVKILRLPASRSTSKLPPQSIAFSSTFFTVHSYAEDRRPVATHTGKGSILGFRLEKAAANGPDGPPLSREHLCPHIPHPAGRTRFA